MKCPITGVNIPRFALSIVVGFGALFGTDMLIHGNLLTEIYEQTAHLWRTPEEMNDLFAYMIGANILLVIVTALIFTRNFESKGIGEGFRFGLMLGALMGIMMGGSYAWMPIPKELAIAWFATGLLQGTLLGIIYSLTYKECADCKK